jgi:hypothetical protein
MRMLCVVIGIALACCSSDGGAKTAGHLCPDELASREHWDYTGDNATCGELADELNRSGDSGDSGDAGCASESIAAMLTETQDGCRATLASSCDGRELAAICDVQPSGAADCRATITTPELQCALALTARY